MVGSLKNRIPNGSQVPKIRANPKNIKINKAPLPRNKLIGAWNLRESTMETGMEKLPMVGPKGTEWNKKEKDKCKRTRNQGAKKGKPILRLEVISQFPNWKNGVKDLG